MLRLTLLCLAAAFLGACASAPTTDVVKGESIATQSTVCDREITGSHLKRCDRTNTESISREDLEMIKSRTNNMPMEPGTTRGR
jgi:hypothetical protein